MTPKQRERFQVLLNTAHDDANYAVDAAFKNYAGDPNESDVEMDLMDAIERLASASTPSERREQLFRIVGEAIVLLALDERKRGSKVIEKEMGKLLAESETKAV